MTFTVWFEDNKDLIESMLRGDAEEALHQAYMAGMEDMGTFMADTFARSPAEPYVDRTRGQFSEWEINRRGDEFS
jgi:hypothetical protein